MTPKMYSLGCRLASALGHHPPTHPLTLQASPELCSPGEGAGVKYSSGREMLSVSYKRRHHIR